MFTGIRHSLVAVLLCATSALFAGADNDTSPLGINLTSPLRYAMDTPFIDEMKRAEILTQSAASWSTGELDRLNYDEFGWPTSFEATDGEPVNFDKFSYLLFGGDYTAWNVPGPRGGIFTVRYEGEGTLGYYLGAQKVGSCGESCDLVQITPSSGIAVLSILATDPFNTGDYLRNIQVLHPGGICDGNLYEWHEDDTSCSGDYTSLVSLSETELFHPEYLFSLKHYRSLRFMNSTFTNSLPIPKWASEQEMLDLPLREWADRPVIADSVWSSEAKGGLPIEVMLKLANELDVTPWLNMPVHASDSYLTEYALQVKDQLRADQTVYVEYGNEIWNSTFGPSSWAYWKASEFFGSENADWTYRLNYFAMRSTEVCQAWKDAWGDEASRVNCVMGAQSAGAWVTQYVVLDCPLWINHEDNPNQGETCGSQMDSLAIAPYFAGYLGLPENQIKMEAWAALGAEGVDKVFEEINTGGNKLVGAGSEDAGSLASATSQMEEQFAVAELFGLELLSYEGGQHLVGVAAAQTSDSITELFTAANSDPRMGDAYRDYMKAWSISGGKQLTLYKSVGPATEFGSWGLLTHQEQITSVKLQATNRFIAYVGCWWDDCSDGIDLPFIDTDGDLTLDTADNCTGVSNAGQRDTNADGYGNICDADFDNNLTTDIEDIVLIRNEFLGSDSHSDLDGDGRVDFKDLSVMKGLMNRAPGFSYVDGSGL